MDEATTTLFTMINEETELNKQIQAKKEKTEYLNKYIEMFNSRDYCDKLKEQNKMLMEENQQLDDTIKNMVDQMILLNMKRNHDSSL